MRKTDDLVRAVLDGDSFAFAELVRRYERAVWATGWKVLRDYHAVQDATQNAFVEAYRQLAQLRRPATFGVWILQIAHREALRIVRKRRSEESLQTAGNLPANSTGIHGLEDYGELMAALGGLPEHERLVVILHYLDGRPVAEVAELTGRPVGTVTKQLSRAIERLKSILAEVPA